VFYHRKHIVWATKYRYKVLTGDVRRRAQLIIRQCCDELGVTMVEGTLAREHAHMFSSLVPEHAISTVMRRLKGRSSQKLQQEFPAQRKRYWGRQFWARG
jgi:putative transposase